MNKELPEYPQSDCNPERHGFSKSYSDFSQADSSNRNFKGGPFGYNQLPYRPMNLPLALGERGEHWKESYDDFEVSSGSQIANPVDRRRFTPESDQSSFNVWKWEGTIAKEELLSVMLVAFLWANSLASPCLNFWIVLQGLV